MIDREAEQAILQAEGLLAQSKDKRSKLVTLPQTAVNNLGGALSSIDSKYHSGDLIGSEREQHQGSNLHVMTKRISRLTKREYMSTDTVALEMSAEEKKSITEALNEEKIGSNADKIGKLEGLIRGLELYYGKAPFLTSGTEESKGQGIRARIKRAWENIKIHQRIKIC